MRARKKRRSTDSVIDRVKALLGERVKDVRLTHRSTDNASDRFNRRDEMSTPDGETVRCGGPEGKSEIHELNPDHVLHR